MALHRRTFSLAALAGVAIPLLGKSQTAGFPSKPVRVTTAFPAGSGPDAALRLVCEQLTKRWGQPVVVDNKPGGNGFIAVAQFKQGAKDGHDLIHLDSHHTTTHPHTFAKLPYDVQKDFTPLRMLQRSHFFVAVPAASPFKTLDELVGKARTEPGKMFYGSWFNGSPGHIGALRLQAITGTQMTHVPFRDFGALYGAVANNEVAWALGSIASAGALEKAGKLRFIAYAGATREPQYPNVPACGEMSGPLRDFIVSAWTGFFAPSGMAPEQRDRVSSDIATALAAPEVMERYKTIGFEAPALDAPAFAALIERVSRSWADVIRNANLKLD
jgi:tripartite-type tricarboxylate transporter receptor subunit TctC